MKRIKMVLLIAGILLAVEGAKAQAKVMRATEMGAAQWSELSQGKLENAIEFRQGDELPISITAEGDFIETRQSQPTYIVVKRSFWLRLSGNRLELSLDGENFKNISDLTTGSLQIGAGSEQSGGVAQFINVVFKSVLK